MGGSAAADPVTAVGRHLTELTCCDVYDANAFGPLPTIQILRVQRVEAEGFRIGESAP